MRKTILVSILLTLPLILSSCNKRVFEPVILPEKDNTRRETVKTNKYKKESSLFADGYLRNGLKLSDTDNLHPVSQPPLTYNGAAEGNPIWGISQWWTANNLKNAQFKNDNNVMKYYDDSHNVIFDTNDGEITLGVNATKEYETEYGKGIINQGNWTHLLLNHNILDESVRNLSELEKNNKHLYLEFYVRIDNMEHDDTKTRSDIADCAQLLLYLQIRKPSSIEDGKYKYNYSSSEYKDYFMWCGFPLYDSRYDGSDIPSYQAADAGQPGASNMYVSSLSTAHYKNYNHKKFIQNYIKIDALPVLKQAYENAKKANYLSKTNWEDMVIMYMNLGFEIPGYFNARATISYLDLYIE